MPTANWLKAARGENKKPVVLMQIEDAAAAEVLYTTRTDWEGSAVATNIDTTSQVGDALSNINVNPTSATDASSVTSAGARWTYAPTIDGFYYNHNQGSLQFQTLSTNGAIGSGFYNTQFTIRETSFAGTIISDFVISVYYNRVSGGGFGFNTYTSGSFSYNPAEELTAATTYYIEVQVFGLTNIQSNPYTITSKPADLDYTPKDAVNCTLTTSTIDTGADLTNPRILSIDDTIQSGATITYTAFGGAADPPVTNLGTVADGDSLTAYQYYRLKADFASTTGGRGSLKQFGLREGVFKWYGTHKDIPFRGVQPYLEMKTLTTLSTAIKLDKGISTTGQFTAVLKWVADVSDFVARGALRGKDVQLLYGFQQLSQADYEPIFTGTWFDYTFDDIKQTITVKCQDILKQFEKVKLPTEEYNSSGVKTSTDIVYTKANGVNTILDIFDKLGIRERYIPDEYATLESGDLSGTDYNVTRTLSQPIAAYKLLDRLAQTLGLFLVPQGNGELFPYLFNAADAAVYTLDASKFSPSGVAGNQDEIATRQYAYYNINDPTVSTPTDEEKFNNAYQIINAGAETKWVNEKSTKIFFDTWRIGNNEINPLTTDTATPPTALVDLVNRWDSWYAEPKFTFSVKDLPPEWMKVGPSNIVEVNNLLVPVANQVWDSGTTYDDADIIIYDGRQYESLQNVNLNKTPDSEPTWWNDMNITSEGLTSGMKFITMKRTVDIRRGSVTLEFRQI